MRNCSGVLASEVKKRIKEVNPEAIVWDGLDDAIVGYGGAFDQCVVIYRRQTILYILMRDNDWSYAEAIEWYEYNIKGGYLGVNTPIVVE